MKLVALSSPCSRSSGGCSSGLVGTTTTTTIVSARALGGTISTTLGSISVTALHSLL